MNVKNHTGATIRFDLSKPGFALGDSSKFITGERLAELEFGPRMN